MDVVGGKHSRAPQIQETREVPPTVLIARSEIKPPCALQILKLLRGLQETVSASKTFVKDVSSSQAGVDLLAHSSTLPLQLRAESGIKSSLN